MCIAKFFFDGAEILTQGLLLSQHSPTSAIPPCPLAYTTASRHRWLNPSDLESLSPHPHLCPPLQTPTSNLRPAPPLLRHQMRALPPWCFHVLYAHLTPPTGLPQLSPRHPHPHPWFPSPPHTSRPQHSPTIATKSHSRHILHPRESTHTSH
jgi:hypothetical protein